LADSGKATSDTQAKARQKYTIFFIFLPPKKIAKNDSNIKRGLSTIY